MPEFEERTEQATPRRRQKAKEKGQVARSRELVSLSATAGIILVFYFGGNIFFKNISELTGRLLGLQYGRDPIAVMKFTVSEMLWIMMPFFGIALTFSIFSGIVQGGFSLKPLTVEIEKINPVEGFKRIFSRYGIVEFLKSLLKFVIGGLIFYCIMKKALIIIPSTAAMDIKDIQTISGRLIAKAVLYILTTFLLFAVIDYIYQRWRFERSIRMTKDELKEEYKETEGDPLIKSRIKSIQMEMAKRRMMQDVPKATVVITNPIHIAVALSYMGTEMSAPKVIAKGAGYIAEKIKEIAREYRIPIVEDKPLARTLYTLKIGSYIPEELYRAVAKILAYIYRLRAVA